MRDRIDTILQPSTDCFVTTFDFESLTEDEVSDTGNVRSSPDLPLNTFATLVELLACTVPIFL